MTGLYSNSCYNEVYYKDFILKIFAYLHICFVKESIVSILFFSVSVPVVKIDTGCYRSCHWEVWDIR